MLLLRKKLHSSLLPIRNPNGSPSLLLWLSTFTAQNPPPKLPFMAEYLTSSCGFPPEEAIHLSKQLTHINSPSKPDAVLHFLWQSGLTNADIKRFISRDPTSLLANVEKTMKPKFRVLQELGFTESEIVDLVSHSPRSLSRCDVQSRIELLRSLCLSNEKILKALRRGKYFLTLNFAKTIMRNITFLRECGIPDDSIGKMMVSTPGFVGRKPESIQALIRRAEELGAPRGSSMFLLTLRTVSGLSKATLDAKFKLLKRLGWSDEETAATFRSCPTVLGLSEKSIHDKVEFLTRVAGCNISVIIRCPVLITYSLGRRLVPRITVLGILDKEGLLRKHSGLASALKLGEKKFAEKYVLPHVEKIPGIQEAYLAASTGLEFL